MDSIDWGVCRLSVISVRKLPGHAMEQVTQLLFGEHYEVIEVDTVSKWLHVRIAYDQYEGWIDSHQHHSVSKEYYQYCDKAEFKITVDLASSILYHKSPLPILMGSIIPISSSELFKMEEQFAFNGEAKNLGTRRDFEYLRSVAIKYLNAPYQWGGRSPFGIDCSGFIQMIYKISGYNLRRDSYMQAEQGRAVESLAETHPGDLCFFKNNMNKVTHVGMLLADGRIIHCSGKVRIDQMSPEGILNAETGVLTHHFHSVRRIFPN